MNFTRVTPVLGAVFLAAIGVACDRSPISPSLPNTNQPGSSSSTQPQPQLRDVKIVGAPAVVHMGTSANLTAAAAYADGTFVDVTSAATWRSSHDACRASGGGMVEAVGGGTAQITATFAGVTSVPVPVACGIFLTVTTHENFPTEHVTVPAVQGEILDGLLAGHTFVTDANGRASLPPAGDSGFLIHVKKPGFENYAYRVRQPSRETNIRIPMTPEFTAQVAFQGQCSSASFQRLIENYPFTTGRMGKLRMRVDLQSDGLAPFAQLFGTIEGVVGRVSAHASVLEKPPSWQPNQPIAEMRVDAGNYQMRLAALSGCSPTDFWRVTLEYSR